MPGWLIWVLEHAKHVLPVVLAFAPVRGGIRRRRRQDELRAARERKSEEPREG